MSCIIHLIDQFNTPLQLFQDQQKYEPIIIACKNQILNNVADNSVLHKNYSRVKTDQNNLTLKLQYIVIAIPHFHMAVRTVFN